jgi:hypothetical protein
MLVASFVVPASLISPAPVEADPGICKWDSLMTPGYLPLKNDVAPHAGGGLVMGWDTHDMAVGGDGATVLLVAQNWTAVPGLPTVPTTGYFNNQLYYTNNNGISFTGTKFTAFCNDYWKKFGIDRATYTSDWTVWPNVWLVAIAPDNPNFWAIVTDGWDGTDHPEVGPYEVWVTANAGGKWECTNIQNLLDDTLPEEIRCIDISVDYGGKRDIAVGTVDGATGDVWVAPSTGFAGWKAQNFDVAPHILGDFYAIKFSPTYASDASLAMVYADANGTYYNIALRDVDSNITENLAFGDLTNSHTILLPPATVSPTFLSPTTDDLNKADLELPSDFSGQAASLRRAYVSLDCYTGTDPKDYWDGILRVDDTTVYVLMDTSSNFTKSIYSIAYFGTYASGKLLAGERMGFPCTATVPTWFTDSPTTCPIPCWYPALKPTTGAADQADCSKGQEGVGAALVGWRADGALAFTATGSHAATPDDGWWEPFKPVWDNTALPPFTLLGNGSLVIKDESAFAISRNNGETWNQIALIDTWVTRFTDVAPTPDCKTVYLASVNEDDLATREPYYKCAGFDSVWRTSSNTEVAAPYPALPIGIFWERVLTRVTAPTCTDPQSNMSLLRLVPYCADPSGQIVAWGAYAKDHSGGEVLDKGVAAWSPDYGDYWANINPRERIQDFCFESATVMYFLSPDGPVQKMPYTGTAWATTLPNVDPVIYGAHTIAAYPEGKVLVGAAAEYHALLYATSYSSNFNTDNPSFTVLSLAGATTYRGNVHVAFDPAFKDNNTIFINDDATTVGSVYRNNVAAQLRWDDTNMMAATNGAVGCNAPHEVAQYGLALAFTGQALYSAHDKSPTGEKECHTAVSLAGDNVTAAEWLLEGTLTQVCTDVGELSTNGGVCRTIDDGTGKFGPLSGMPKPGVAWDCLDVFVRPYAGGVVFSLEPSSLKACGCCTLDTDTTLYAIDDNTYSAGLRRGLVWAFTDCMAKKGPKLITADKTLIGCDPVSGRAQEVNLCWEQLCVASKYDIEIAKSADFTIKIIDWVSEAVCGGLEPADVTKPCVFFPAGGKADFYEGSAIAMLGNLECGHTYYWRVKVRECATTQDIRSPWSEVRSFTIKAGLPVTTPYYGVQLLAPNNGGLGIPVKPVSFSWSPFKETTKYKFVLAKDAAMTQVVKEADVATTAFEYDGALEYSSNYFWRVMSLEPAPSDWSATFSFLTEAAPPVAPGPTPAPPTPMWVWVVIALGAILVIVTLVLIFKTRRV